MHITPLAIEDLLLCEKFGRAFHSEKVIPGEFSLDAFIRNWSYFITSDIGVIFGLYDGDSLVGGIGGVTTPDLTTGELITSEMFWYIDEACRHNRMALRLVDRLRAWGKEKGATRFRMVHLLMPGESPSTVRLASVYRRMGLRPIEVAYDGPIGD